MQEAASKYTKYSRKETTLTIGHHAKAIAHAKSSLWFKKKKFRKTCQNPFYKSLRVFLCKKPLQKTPNILEIRVFLKSANMQRLYSPCKIITLAQKLKFQKTCQNPFYKSFTVVLRKKPLQKNRNIPEMRPF